MTTPRVLRYLIVNLARERVTTTTGNYADAVRIAEELERDTRQLHGVERVQRMRAMTETVTTGSPATVGALYRELGGERVPNGFDPPKVVSTDGFTYTYRVTQ